MFNRVKPPTSLENATDKALTKLDTLDPTTEQYVKVLNSVSTLHKMKEAEKPSQLSKDTLAIIGANLLGIFMIIRHENVNVITSKALNMVLRRSV